MQRVYGNVLSNHINIKVTIEDTAWIVFTYKNSELNDKIHCKVSIAFYSSMQRIELCSIND